MGFGKKEMQALLNNNLAMMKEMAKGNAGALKLVEEQEKKVKEAMGEQKSIGPCFGCKELEVVSQKDYDYKFARWFMCPHKELFCPDCLGKSLKEARKKRKEQNEQRKKDKKEKEKKDGKK